MLMRKRSLLRGLKLSALSVVMAFSLITSSFVFAEPITAHATLDEMELYKLLGANEKKVYDIYETLEDQTKSRKMNVTPGNFHKHAKKNFYKVYTNSAKKKKFKASEIRNGKRAYVYTHPTKLAAAMSSVKFVYLEKTKKNGKKSYSCYAYLKRHCDSNLKSEQKQLESAISSIMDGINDENDTELTAFTTAYTVLKTVLDSTSFKKKVGIDDYSLYNTAYGALVQKRATSLGYCLAYEALMNEAEIDCNILTNNEYCWVQTCIAPDGMSSDETKYFETDLVFSDYKKTIRYDRFGISSGAMKAFYKRKGYCKKLPKSMGTRTTTLNYLSQMLIAVQ